MSQLWIGSVSVWGAKFRREIYSRMDSFPPVAFVRWGRLELDFRERFPVDFLVAVALPGSFAALSGSIFRGCCTRTTGGGGGGWLLKAASRCSMSSLWYAYKVRMAQTRNKGQITD